MLLIVNYLPTLGVLKKWFLVLGFLGNMKLLEEVLDYLFVYFSLVAVVAFVVVVGEKEDSIAKMLDTFKFKPLLNIILLTLLIPTLLLMLTLQVILHILLMLLLAILFPLLLEFNLLPQTPLLTNLLVL